MHNAQAFIDEDGTAWLYWGSDESWGNARRCWAVRLKPDMITIDGEVRDITPTRYASSPVMLKHGDCYYLTYTGKPEAGDAGSNPGKDSATRIHYAISRSPLGPFQEGVNSPLSLSEVPNHTASPGHHAVFTSGGRSYILYHRHTLPFNFHAIVRRLRQDPLSAATASSLAGRTDKARPGRYGPRPLAASGSAAAGVRRPRRRFAFAL